jgi:hypothetical protein
LHAIIGAEGVSGAASLAFAGRVTCYFENRGSVMFNDTTRKCSHVGDDGSRCKAAPMRRRKYCFFHDPAMKKRRQAASRDGGMRRGQKALADLRMPPDLFTKPLEFHSNADLAELMRQMLVRLCRNEINPLLVSIVEHVVKTMMRAREEEAGDQDWFAAGEKNTVENPLAGQLLSRMTGEEV